MKKLIVPFTFLLSLGLFSFTTVNSSDTVVTDLMQEKDALDIDADALDTTAITDCYIYYCENDDDEKLEEVGIASKTSVLDKYSSLGQ